MQTYFRIVLILALVVPTYIQAQNTTDTIDVIATGVGKDDRTARENAVRAAVEQAVGKLVSHEILIKNEADKITKGEKVLIDETHKKKPVAKAKVTVTEEE